MIVYLAGPINGCSDPECNDWRSYAKQNLRCETLDPMRRDYRGREMDEGIAAIIVTGDEQDVASSDIVLANHPKPSTGTDMEIRMAKSELHKIVVVVIPVDCVPSPWLVHHSDIIFRCMADAVRWINQFVRSADGGALCGN